ncbi:S1 family peptidase [Hymenobacter coccineus]|uniref:S1 family peptidase n=1 Tax=Hymenobacter coccineus TaxID=1908235 RepID=UPI000F79FB0F|nr:serine protease [Hymenobacter coccineus]
MPDKQIQVNPISHKVIFIELLFNETVLSSATAFFAKAEDKMLLLTNRHNVTGRNNDTGEYLSKMGGIPNKIRICLPVVLDSTIQAGTKKLGAYQHYTVDLYRDENFELPVWIEHPFSIRVDVVGLIIKIPDDLDLQELAFDASEGPYRPEIGATVNVLGFPYGLSTDGFPIWTSGYIASEPNIDYENLPMFLIDCRTRQGQSGSPVISILKKGESIIDKGVEYEASRDIYYLRGIYSGRINSESDLGKVWKISVIREILINGIMLLPKKSD